MAAVTPTTFIQYGDISFEVAKMSPDNQRLVEILDEARQQEEDALVHLIRTRATIRGIQTTFAEAIQAAQAAAAAETPEKDGE